LPVTFHFTDGHGGQLFRKKRVVCAYGAHINRLRNALVDHWHDLYGQPEERPAELVEAA
jgi:hypothetical protein